MDKSKLDERMPFTPITLYMDYMLLRYNNYLKDKLDDLNITQGEMSFIYNIFYHKSLSQRELAEVLFVSEAYVTKMLNKLEKKDYVERKVDENNSSRKIVFLSPKGELLVHHILKLTYEWEAMVTQILTDEENDSFKHILHELTLHTIDL